MVLATVAHCQTSKMDRLRFGVVGFLDSVCLPSCPKDYSRRPRPNRWLATWYMSFPGSAEDQSPLPTSKRSAPTLLPQQLRPAIVGSQIFSIEANPRLASALRPSHSK